MENWRENFSMISRLKVAGPQTDALASRLFFERLFGAANFHPPGLPPRSVVCIRKLAAPPLGSRKLAGANLALAWETGVRAEVEKLVRRAFRPLFEIVPAQTESVIFEDVGEMLACLARDWLRGVLFERWWWRSLFPKLLSGGQKPSGIWRASAEFAPPALQILSKTDEAAQFVGKLSPTEVSALLREITGVFGLNKLRAAVDGFKASPGRSRKTEKTPRWTKPDAFSRLLSPGLNAADLSFERQVLLEAGLLLARAPRLARSDEFAAHVTAKREISDLRETAGSQKTIAIFEKPNVQSPTTRQTKKQIVSKEPEFSPNLPPPEIHESPVFVAEKESKGEDLRGDQPPGSLKTPAAPPEAFVEAKTAGEIKRRKTAIEFFREEGENRKSAPKTRTGGKIIAPATTGKIFADFFETAEKASEFSFQTSFGGVFYLLNLGLYLGLYSDFTESFETEIDLNIWDFVALLALEFLGGELKRDAVWDFLKDAAERANDDEIGREFDQKRDWRMPPAWLETFPEKREWRWAKNKKRLVVRHADGFHVIDVAARGAAAAQLENELENYPEKFARVVRAEKTEAARMRSKDWVENLAEYLQKRLFQALRLQTPAELNAILFERPAMVAVSATHLEITFALADLPIEVRLAGIDRDPAWIPAAGKFVYFHFV